jgi:hypothetical protein
MARAYRKFSRKSDNLRRWQVYSKCVLFNQIMSQSGNHVLAEPSKYTIRQGLSFLEE